VDVHPAALRVRAAGHMMSLSWVTIRTRRANATAERATTSGA